MLCFDMPDDIMIMVIQTWLCDDQAHKTLSALDIACTNSSARRSFLQCIATVCLPHSTDKPILSEGSGFRPLATAAYMRWIAARQLKAEFLGLMGGSQIGTEQEGAVLTCVKHISKSPETTASALTAALQLCPQVRSLFSHAPAGTGRAPSVTWNVLALPQVALGSLEWLCVQERAGCKNVCEKRSRVLRICEVLQKISPSLRHLAVYDVMLTESIITALQSCACLEEVAVRSVVHPRGMVQLIKACRRLHTVSIKLTEGWDTADLNAILEAGRGQLKKFAVVVLWFNASSNPYVERLFADTLVRHAWLDELKLQAFHYKRSENMLKVLIGQQRGALIEVQTLEQIVMACQPPITALTLILHDGNLCPLVHKICEILCTTVVDLTINVENGNCGCGRLVRLPTACPGIRRLSMSLLHSDQLTDCGLTQIAAKCAELQAFSLNIRGINRLDEGSLTVTDTGLEALISSCPKLEEISLLDGQFNATKRTLRAIALRGLPFKALTVKGGVHFGEKDIEEFRQLARVKGVLPVPLLKISAR